MLKFRKPGTYVAILLYTFESESEVAQSFPTLCDPMAVAYQAPSSMGFSRQEYWSGLPGDLPDPGIKPRAPALQADSLPSEPPGKPGKIYMVRSILFSYHRAQE